MKTIEETTADLKRAELNLKACLYEDGGLVSRARWDVDRLKIQLFDKLTKDIPLDRLQEICQAERDGRLVELPCKVGDTVFAKIGHFQHKFIETKVLQVYNNGFSFKVVCDGIGTLTWGKSVFLTKAEAEKALKEREGK